MRCSFRELHRVQRKEEKGNEVGKKEKQVRVCCLLKIHKSHFAHNPLGGPLSRKVHSPHARPSRECYTWRHRSLPSPATPRGPTERGTLRSIASRRHRAPNHILPLRAGRAVSPVSAAFASWKTSRTQTPLFATPPLYLHLPFRSPSH